MLGAGDLRVPQERDTFLHRGGRASRYGNWGVCISVASADEADSYRYIASCFGVVFRSLDQVCTLQRALPNADHSSATPRDEAAESRQGVHKSKSFTAIAASAQKQLDALLRIESAALHSKALQSAPPQTAQSSTEKTAVEKKEEKESRASEDAAIQQEIREALQIAALRREALSQQTTSLNDQRKSLRKAAFLRDGEAEGLSESVELKGCFLRRAESASACAFLGKSEMSLAAPSARQRPTSKAAAARECWGGCRFLRLGISPSDWKAPSTATEGFSRSCSAVEFCPVHELAAVSLLEGTLEAKSALCDGALFRRRQAVKDSLLVPSQKKEDASLVVLPPTATSARFVRRSRAFADSAETALVLFEMKQTRGPSRKGESAAAESEQGISADPEGGSPNLKDKPLPLYFVAALSARELGSLYLLLSAATPVSQQESPPAENKAVFDETFRCREPSLDVHSAARWSAFVASLNVVR